MTLDDLIARSYNHLKVPDGLNRHAFLHALADVESNHGERGLAILHEPAYCYGGVYYKGPNGDDLRRLSRLYGCLAHSSFSSWQLLFIAAWEEGFRGDPCELRNDEVALPHVIHFLNRRIFDRYPRIGIAEAADAWNSGRPYDANQPEAYIARFQTAYDARLKEQTADGAD